MAWPFQIEWGTCGANAAQSLPAVQQHKFDLASLTKVIATSTLLVDHYLSTQKSWESWLNAPVSTTVTELRNSPWETTTLRQFWEHRSGMAAHILLRGLRGQPVASGPERLAAQAEALEALLRLPKSAPVHQTVYSDLGFFILGLYLERSTDASQLELWQAWRMDHLGVTNQLKYFAELTSAERAVVLPTESDRHAAGSVNDDNAFNLGEQAAHAGLTGRVADVLDWMQTLAAWEREEPRLKPWLQQAPVESQRFIYGWDTPTPATPGGNSQGGRSAPPLTRGHLGYTGTALWMDPTSTTGGVLLTNRVYPLHSPDSQQIIRELRTEFFTALWQNKDLGRDEWLQIVQKKFV